MTAAASFLDYQFEFALTAVSVLRTYPNVDECGPSPLMLAHRGTHGKFDLCFLLVIEEFPMHIVFDCRERLTRFLRIAMVLTIGIFGVGGCKEKQQPVTEKDAQKPADGSATNRSAVVTLTPEAVRQYAIKIDHAESRVFTPTFIAPGEVSFDTERISQVGSAVPGRVVELKARIGDKVTKGQDLVVIDSPELAAAQSDHLQKRTAVEVAKPAVALATSSYDRAKRLADNVNLSLSELERRAGELKAADGNLQMAQSAVIASLNRLRILGMDDRAIDRLDGDGKIDSKFVIRAPMAGQVVERAVTLGQLVSPDKDSVITIVDVSTVWVLADVPQAKLSELSVGAAAKVRGGDHSDIREGTVSFIPPQLDPSTRTARVRIAVKNDNELLRAGMFCQVEIALKSQASSNPVVVIPEAAVQSIDGTPSVFTTVEGKQDTFAPKAVTVGAASGGMVPVEKGLSAGQPFVSSGTFVLKAELGKSSIEE